MDGGRRTKRAPDPNTGTGGVDLAEGLPLFGGTDVEAVGANLEVVHFGSQRTTAGTSPLLGVEGGIQHFDKLLEVCDSWINHGFEGKRIQTVSVFLRGGGSTRHREGR